MLDLDPINFIGAGIALALLYQSVRLVRKRKESVFEFLLWAGFGGALLVFSLAQTVTVLGAFDAIGIMLEWLGFNGGLDGVFALAILGLLLLLFYTYVNAKTNRKHLYDLNQEIALMRFERRNRGPSEKIDDHTDD